MINISGSLARAVMTFVVFSVLSGCAATYYSVWETLGFQRRDLVTGRVDGARDSLVVAADAFDGVIDSMSPIINRSGPALDSDFTRLESAYRSADRAANAVSERIENVESASQGLFLEWESELAQGVDSPERRTEQQELADARQAYNTLIGSLRSAEVGFSPVLLTARDSIRALQRGRDAPASDDDFNVFAALGGDIDRLARELRESASVADGFVRLLTP